MESYLYTVHDYGNMLSIALQYVANMSSKVVVLFKNEPSTKFGETTGGTMAWVHVTINGEEICSTPGHKYHLPNNKEKRSINEKLEHASYEGLGVEWVSAEHLKAGDIVLLANG